MSEKAGQMSGVAAGLVVAGLIVLALVAVATGGADALEGQLEQIDIDADTVTLHAGVQSDGDATWEVTYRIRLEDENATAAFEQLQADIDASTAAYLDRFGGRMERTVAGAENATGRQMAVRNLTVDTNRETQPQVEYGIVTYRFEWTNFAASDGEVLRVGDAIDQLFLEGDSSLRVTWPDGYVVDSRTPAPTREDETELVWQGRLDFDAGEPRVDIVPADETPTATPGDATGGTPSPTGTSTVTETPAGPGTEPGTGSGGLPMGFLLLVAVLAVLGSAWVVTRDAVTLPIGETSDGDAGGDESGAVESDDGPPPELLSNEERVLGLLEERGGRMKQKEVADQLDWTAAKTSQVVGDLRDEGELDSFRLGRENVLTLPEVDVEGGDEGDSTDT
jgi:hypothetical protein